MVQLIKVLTAKSDDLSFFPGTQMLEGEKSPLQAVLWHSY